jgi:hypothetical protein
MPRTTERDGQIKQQTKPVLRRRQCVVFVHKDLLDDALRGIEMVDDDVLRLDETAGARRNFPTVVVLLYESE